MREISKVEIQPCTQGALSYSIGERIYEVGIAYHERFTVSDIKVLEHPETGEVIIQIYVENQLYAEYFNVPYAIFYKLVEQ